MSFKQQASFKNPMFAGPDSEDDDDAERYDYDERGGRGGQSSGDDRFDDDAPPPRFGLAPPAGGFVEMNAPAPSAPAFPSKGGGGMGGGMGGGADVAEMEGGGEDPAVAHGVVSALYAKYKKNYARRTDYVSLFSFVVFVGFYLAILFMQRQAEEAYSLTSTLKSEMIPEKLELQSGNEVRQWISALVKKSWTDPRCGDGRCEMPFEYPEYGRFGCKADCDLLTVKAKVTPIQVDVYYNFSHPKGSVSPIDLMNDASWNLCPMEVDDVLGGTNKIYHGADCYYEKDQKFDTQVGHQSRVIEDVPDGEWTIVVKKDIFKKVGGAVRVRANVVKEADNKRLLLASHYAQLRRKTELAAYDATLTTLGKSNQTLALEYLEKLYLAENTTIYARNDTGLAGNKTANEAAWALNKTLVNGAYEAAGYCVANSVRLRTAMATGGTYANWYDHSKFTTQCTTPNGASGCVWNERGHIKVLVGGAYVNKNPACTCNAGPPISCQCYSGLTPTGGAAAVSSADAKDIACVETFRWIDQLWVTTLAQLWTDTNNVVTTTKATADAEFASVLLALQTQSPVTHYEINKMVGTNAQDLKTASLNVLKDADVLKEHNADATHAAVIAARSSSTPYWEQLRDIITPRRNSLQNVQKSTPIYPSPVTSAFTFTANAAAVGYVRANYPGYGLTDVLTLSLKEWNPSVLLRQDYAFTQCELPSRLPEVVGACKTPASVTTPTVANPANTAQMQPFLQQTRFQKLCDAVCDCAVATNGAGCAAGSHCVCPVCSVTNQFANVIYPKGYTGRRKLLEHEYVDAGDVGDVAAAPKYDFTAPYRRRLQAATLDSIQTAISTLTTKQTSLDTAITTIQTTQTNANVQANAHHADTALDTLITRGFTDVNNANAALQTTMNTILSKQQLALDKVTESLAIQQRTETLAAKGVAQIEKLALAVEKQTASISAAWAAGAFTSIDQYVQIQENAVVTREVTAKTNSLSNSPCTTQEQFNNFALDNHENVYAKDAFRERYIGLNNRVIAGMLIYTKRKNLVKCDSNRFEKIDDACSEGRDVSSYGVDPVFKLGTPMYKPTYDNKPTVTKVYNCSELNNPSEGISPTYNPPGSTDGNKYPYCKELFNPRDIPYGFRVKSIPGYADGFPYIFDINLSAKEAETWVDYMEYGLMIDDVKTDVVSAQVVVYNAELGYFGNVVLYFEFTDGGKIEVTYGIDTIKVELYETIQDWIRLAMECLLAIGAAHSVYAEIMDFMDSKKTRGSYLAYFQSAWNYVDIVSIFVHVLTIFMWFSYAWAMATAFAPSIHYKIYKNLAASAHITNLKVPNEMDEMASMFLEMKSLVTYFQMYMTLSGINIILMLGRILKLMDFQPRLGVITRTLALATADLAHFFVIFALVFVGYAFIGHVIFGYASEHFSDMTSSINSLFMNLLGDITYFMEDLKNLTGMIFWVGMIYFYTYNIFVFMILFNFLLAIICDAFGEVKANASEAVSVTAEIGPMLRDKWRSVWRPLFYRDHIPEERVRRQLRIWKGEDPDEPEYEEDRRPKERVFTYANGEKELDAAGLKRVLRRCVIETYQNSDKTFNTYLLRPNGVGSSKALATAAEIDQAAAMLMRQVGHRPKRGPDGEGGVGHENEVQTLQRSLERLIKSQQKLVEGQVKVIDGQSKMASRQERLSDLEHKILGVLEKPPGSK